MKKHRGLLLILTVSAFALAGFAGCGDDDGDDDGTASTAATTETAATTGKPLTIKMGDFFFSPKDVNAGAGTVTIATPNEGKTTHEFVLVKSDADPASLPVKQGEVDEDAVVTQGSGSPNEIADVKPGQSKSGTFELTPGKYVMFCNLPGHYQQGMYGSVTVK